MNSSANQETRGPHEDYLCFYNPTTGSYELQRVFNVRTDRTSHIDLTFFDAEQWSAYTRAKDARGLNYEYAGGPFPIPAPMIISDQLSDELRIPATKLREYIIEKYLKDADTISNRIAADPSFFGATNINIPEINQQLADHVEQGFLPPLHYDVLMTQEEGGKAGFKVVEHQMCTSYAARLGLMREAALKADPTLSDMQSGDGNYKASLISLKQLSNGQPIAVMDTHVSQSPTLPDKLGMAKLLGDQESQPLSLLDVYKDNDQWMCHIRNAAGKIVNTVELHYVYCRAMDSDLRTAYQEANEEQRTLIAEFLKDPTIQWIFHPSRTKIFTKAHTGELKKIQKAKHHYIDAYSEREVVPPGLYRSKPTDGNSNEGQENVTIQQGEKFVVPKGRIFQKRMNLYPFPVHVDIGESKRAFLGTLEIRCFLLPSIAGSESYNFVSRFVPKYLNRDEETPTNVGGAVGAIKAIEEHHRNLPSDTRWPFGFVPTLVQKDT